MTEQTTEAAVGEVWQAYLDRTAKLGRDYEATIDAALVRLGQATSDAYAAYDEQTHLAWDVWQSATEQARQERDRAVADLIEAMPAPQTAYLPDVEAPA